MKRFTLIFVATLMALFTWAQNPLARSASPLRSELKTQMLEKSATQNAGPLAANALQMPVQQAKAKAPRRAEAEVVTPPEGEVVYYKYSGTAVVNQQATSLNRTVKVIFDGNDVYVQGMTYYVTDAWVKGTIDGETATFATGQYLGDGLGVDLYFAGSDGDVMTDVTADYDAETGNFTINSYILDNAYADELDFYSYVASGATLTKIEGEVDLPVEAPEDLETAEYNVTGTSYDFDDNDELVSQPVSFNVKAGFVMTSATSIDIYVQGLCSYLPEAWVKGTGTMDGSSIKATLPSGQFFGTYGSSYDMYFVGLTTPDAEAEVVDVVFDFDIASTTLTLAEGTYVAVNGAKDEADWYTLWSDLVITPVEDKAAMPADPEITKLTETDYGYVVEYVVPTCSTDGEGLISDKLYFTLYTETDGEVEELTFTPATHKKLTEDMTEVPVNFRDNYDFEDGYLYLNDLYSEDWNKIGIQSIYYGGDERNATEIQWLVLKTTPEGETTTATFDFNAMDVATSSNDGTDGDILEAVSFEEEDVTLTISPKDEEASTQNRFWATSNGPQLRVYSGTLTFEVPEGATISEIVFNYNSNKWGADNAADSGEITNDADAKTATWAGEAQVVVVSIAANSQINSIDVTYTMEGGETPDPELVELPEGVETEVWSIEGTWYTSYGEALKVTTEMAFDGTDVYLKGLPQYFEDAWIKGTLYEDEGYIVFPSGQFVGEDESGYEFICGLDETGELTDIVFAYDEAREMLYQVTPYILENSEADEFSPFAYITQGLLYPGELKTFEGAELPEGVETAAYNFTAMELTDAEEEEEYDGVRGRKAPRTSNVKSKVAKVDDGDDGDEFNMESYSFQIQVGFDGKDVYFQGFTDDISDFWVKGTMSEDGTTVTIPANQYLGTYDVGGYGMWTYDYYLAAVDEDNNIEDVVLTYDADANTFSTDQMLVLHDKWYMLGTPYQSFLAVDITMVEEIAATPADPSITSMNIADATLPYICLDIPTVDTNGNALIVAKLFYTVWYEKDDAVQQQFVVTAAEYSKVEEDMTEVPYVYDDAYDIYRGGERFYINPTDEAATWKKIGVQSIYYGGGECNKSNIVWTDELNYDGIVSISANGNNAVIYDMQGRRVKNPTRGIFITNGKKVLVK